MRATEWMFQIDWKSMWSLYAFDDNLSAIMIGMPFVLNYSFIESHAFVWLRRSARFSHLVKSKWKDCYADYQVPYRFSVSSGGKARMSEHRTAAK